MQYDTLRKISFVLHVHKFRMARICDERKWIDMHVNKKSDLNALFFHKYTNSNIVMLVGISL
jgi:hypothetical protein